MVIWVDDVYSQLTGWMRLHYFQIQDYHLNGLGSRLSPSDFHPDIVNAIFSFMEEEISCAMIFPMLGVLTLLPYLQLIFAT